jgi:hypothetical protein
MRRRLEWKDQWQRPGVAPGDEVVWIDVAKLDANWRGDRAYYIGVGGKGSELKYTGFGQWLRKTAEPIWRPLIAIEDGQVGFTDGRHRFAWLRDHGVEALPIACDPDQAAEIKRRFGTRKRISWLP